MLLPNTNAVLLLLTMWYYSAPSQAIYHLGTILLLLKPGSTRRPPLPRFVAWMADLLWVPLLAYMGQPIITDMLHTFAHQQLRLFLVITLGVPASFVFAWLLVRHREDQHAV